MSKKNILFYLISHIWELYHIVSTTYIVCNLLTNRNVSDCAKLHHDTYYRVDKSTPDLEIYIHNNSEQKAVWLLWLKQEWTAGKKNADYEDVEMNELINITATSLKHE